MKILEIDWQAFLQVLEYYRRLPYGARRFLVEKVSPSQAAPNAAMDQWREPLLESGIMIAGPQGKNAQVDRRFQSFVRVIRAMGRNRIFRVPTRESFHVFVSEHFEGPEITAFSGVGHQYYYYRDYAAVQGLFSRVCAAAWVKGFLEAEDPHWETPYQAAGSSPYFSSAAVLHAAQALIQKLVPGAVPVPLAQLPGMCPELRLDVLGAAMRAGFRYLLFYPCLLGEGLEPGLGLWPAAARKLSTEIPRPPEPVTVSHPFHSPFLVDDMTAVLSACAVAPPRLRVNDEAIFEADQRNLEAGVGTLPEWIEKAFHFNPANRIAIALDFLRHHQFLEQKGRRERAMHMEITELGTDWLRLGGKERLKAVLDGLRSQLKDRSSPVGYQSVSLVPNAGRMSLGRHVEQVASALRRVFKGIEAGVFVRLRDFLAYHRDRDNPFATIHRDEPYGSVVVAGRSVSQPSSDELDEAWEEQLADFLQLRLVPLGGAKAGADGDGAICFALTDAGKYLLDAADDFQLGQESQGRIVLQPNCDVVFLAPSAKAESEIARFSERLGRHVGTLFKVTKPSILAAAASGLKAQQVLNTLREYCGADLPANVEREIVGWFGQFRRVTMVPAMLIHCPDAETATRVISAAGGRVTRLTDTTLEWHEQKPQPALLKKLREMGIFLRER
ncbi:hypothetical protein SBA4_4590043 [Candidatus Sulfopaludibacter sp. SbA4]|nr:hypothetical protein SBA4_4590043 [Candidatus Sulfopaludibacter sp. SbA4]